MTDIQLSPEEQHVVSLFAAMPREAKVRLPIWFVELVVPLALAVGGWISGYYFMIGAAFGGLLTLHAQRLFRQFKYARELQSICSKVQAHVATQATGA